MLIYTECNLNVNTDAILSKRICFKWWIFSQLHRLERIQMEEIDITCVQHFEQTHPIA